MFIPSGAAPEIYKIYDKRIHYIFILSQRLLPVNRKWDILHLYFLKICCLQDRRFFFGDTLDSENRIIYNTGISEFDVEKFISFGSGVI